MIAGVQPDSRAGREAQLIDCHAIAASSQSIEAEHAIEGLAEPIAERAIIRERADGLVGNQRREWVHAARSCLVGNTHWM